MTLQKITRIVAIVGIFVIPFIPLIVTNSLFFPFITGKNFTFRIAIEIVFAAWLILAVIDTNYRPRWSWMSYLLVAFVAVMAIADIFSANPGKSFWSNYERMEGWVTLIHLLAYFIVSISILTKEKLWDAFFQTALGVNGIILVYSALQLAQFVTIDQGGIRVDATLGNAAYAAIYAVFNIFIAALYLTRRHSEFKTYKNGFLALGFNVGFFAFILPILQQVTHNQASSGTALLWAFIAWVLINLALYVTSVLRQERLIYAVLIVLDVVMLYYSATRGAILGFIGGVFITSLVVAIWERENKILRRISFGVIVAAVVVVVGFLGVRNTQFVQKNMVLNRFATISLSETTTLSRFKLWNMAIQGFKQRPILGWGQESFNYVFNTNYNPALYNQEPWFDRTHNVILDWLIAGGVLGLAAYLAFFGSIFYFIWKRRSNTLTVVEKGLLTGMLAAYFVHNLFVFDNVTSYIFFITIASYVYFRTMPKNDRPHTHSENSYIAPVVAIALIAVIYAVNLRPLMANTSLISAISSPSQSSDLSSKVEAFKETLSYHTFGDQEAREQLLGIGSQVAAYVAQQKQQQQQTQIKGAQELVNLASQEAKNQVKETPNDARAYVIGAGFFAQAGDTTDALSYLETAHKLSPKKQSISFALGSVYIMQSKYDQAYQLYKQTYESEPSYLDAKLYYAAAAIYDHKGDEADAVLKDVSISQIAGSNDIMAAYYNTKQYKRLASLWEVRVKSNPSSAQNHVSLAAAYILSGDKKGAIAEIREAIKLEPSFKDQGEQYIKEIQAGKTP